MVRVQGPKLEKLESVIAPKKQFDINTQKTKYRWDTLFGVAMLQPEMAGIQLFSQT